MLRGESPNVEFANKMVNKADEEIREAEARLRETQVELDKLEKMREGTSMLVEFRQNQRETLRKIAGTSDTTPI